MNKDAQDRQSRAIEKIKKALDEERCTLEPSITIVGKQIKDAQIIVVPIIDKRKEQTNGKD